MAASQKPAQPGSARQSLGRRGETLAADYLAARGYKILARNYRSAYGEIDLVTLQPAGGSPPGGPVLVFVEVKTRSSNAYGFPEESVTPAKQSHLIRSAQAYLQEHPQHQGAWRIDVITVRMRASGRSAGAEIEHFENAVN